jgi:hypothetical protein
MHDYTLHCIALELQWRKWGSYVRAWRSSPSLLDGFAYSRTLAVMGERSEVAQQHLLSPVLLVSPRDAWQPVRGAVLNFEMHVAGAALFTYGLPVTQHGHPSFDSWTWGRWSSIAVSDDT